MANIKNLKNANPRGSVNIAIGTLMPKVKAIAAAEKRSVNKQIEKMIQDWLDNHTPTAPRGAA